MKKLVFLIVCFLFLVGCAKENIIVQKPIEKVEKLAIAADNKITYSYLLSDMFKAVADNVSIEETGGSIENIELLSNKKVDIAFVQSDIAFYAKNGIKMYEGKKIESLKGVTSLYPEGILILTLAKNNIKAFPEVKGKNLAVGTMGSSMHLNVLEILATYDIKPEEVEFSYLPIDDSIEALLDGQVDVIFITTAVQTQKIKDVAKREKPVFLSIDQLMIEKLVVQNPFYKQMTIEKNTYDVQNYYVNTVAIETILLANESVSENLVYNILQTIFLQNAMQEFVGYKDKTVKNQITESMSIYLHKGTEKFLQEN